MSHLQERWLQKSALGLYSEAPGALSLISNMNSNRLIDRAESHTVSTEEEM